ncbi:MAG: peptidoglycan editing factor PgeF [Hyphomicrobiales bacterium]
MIIADVLASDNVRHGFFTRQGGHSKGLYESLNAGLGTNDVIATVMRNRVEVASQMGVEPQALISPYQYHSANVAIALEPWDVANRPKADAVVAAKPGIALAVTTADCTPVLFSEPEAGIVGAAHSGWKGALGGVSEQTLKMMEALGAKRERICAAIGPTISQEAYEVGPEFFAFFVEEDAAYERFFVPSVRENHYQFDLPGFVEARLKDCGVGQVENMKICTYGDEERFFSYRRTTHRGEPDYGCQISAITLIE